MKSDKNQKIIKTQKSTKVKNRKTEKVTKMKSEKSEKKCQKLRYPKKGQNVR